MHRERNLHQPAGKKPTSAVRLAASSKQTRKPQKSGFIARILGFRFVPFTAAEIALVERPESAQSGHQTVAIGSSPTMRPAAPACIG